MSIDDFFNQTITLKRLNTTSGNKAAYTTVSSIKGHRQNLSQVEVEAIDGATSKSYKIWCSLDEDVDEGDRMTIKGIDYEVISIELKDYGTNQHLEVICDQLDSGGQ